MSSKKDLIKDIRLGYRDIQDLGDDAIIELFGYFLPSDVRGLCFGEIARRRNQRLATKREKINATGAGGKTIERSA